MDSDLGDLRRHYEELTDDALLAVQREDLVEAARACYDVEMRQRNLTAPREVPAATEEERRDDLVEIDSFVFPDEAGLAQALLETAEIPSYLANEHTLSVNWNLTQALGGLKLMVPRDMVAQAREVLATRVSDDDLEAQAEAAGDSASLEARTETRSG